MKKVNFILVKTNLLLICISATLGIGVGIFYNNPINHNESMSSDSQINLGMDNIDNKKFDGHLLDKAAVQALGWDQKTSITLDDWAQYAPNVTTLANFATSGSAPTAPFESNTILESIEIPAKVTDINFGSFAFASNLKSITFEANSQLKFIGNAAFRLSGLNSITIPSKVIKIGDFAFSEISSLLTVNFEPNSHLEEILPNSFYSSGLTSIVIPNSVKWISNSAFRDTIFLEIIIIPHSLAGEDYLEPKFGLTQEQWDLIIWSDIPKVGMIDGIIANQLLLNDSELNWGKISEYDGIKSEAFKNTNITKIEILSKDNFIIEDNAFIDTSDLNDISMSIQYELNVKNYGFTSDQEMKITWLNDDNFVLSRNSIIFVGSLSGVAALIIILNIIIFSKMKKSNINNAIEYDDETQEQ